MTETTTTITPAVPVVDRPALRAGLLAAVTLLLDAARAVDADSYAGDEEGLADDAVRWLEQVDDALVPVRTSVEILAAQDRYAEARRLDATDAAGA